MQSCRDHDSNPNAAFDSISADSPAGIRRQVAEIVRSAVDADAAIFNRYSLDEKGTYFTSVEVVGEPAFDEGMSSLDSNQTEPCPFRDPHYPPEEAEQKFELIEYVGKDALRDQSKQQLACDRYEEVSVRAEATAMLYDGSYFLGRLSVFRLEAGTFTHEEIERLDSLVEPAVEKLVQARELEVELLGDKPARILINPKLLNVEAATGNAFNWLGDERKDKLLEEIDKLEVGESYPVKLVIDGYAVWVTQMAGELGMRLLATVECSPVPEKKPDAVLTPRQREVAGYAAAGATNREIAETLDITPDTVSDHLSEAYRRLGVANRVELAMTLTQHNS